MNNRAMAFLRPKYLILILPVLLLACSKGEAEEKPKHRDPISTAVAVVQPASGTEIIQSAGIIRLRRETALGFTSPGKVALVRYDEGDTVKRGAVLAALDNSAVSADLDIAEAERQRADAELERIRSLYGDGWVTRARLEQSEAASKAARARVEASRFASRTARIVAPSGGVILARNIDAGQIVSAGQTAIILGETGKGFVLRVPLADGDASRLRVGMRAMVTLSVISDTPFEAIISEKDGRADPRTGTFEVSFLLPGNGRLRSGQLGTVAVEVSRGNDGAIAVPTTAIFGLRSGEGLVFVVDKENRVKQRAVTIGGINDENLEITSGLVAGDIIVTRGLEKLHDGDIVKPIRAVK